MMRFLVPLLLGTFACSYASNRERFEEFLQSQNPTIFIENHRWEPIRFRTQLDTLGTVPGSGERCFEIKQKGKIIISFEYSNAVYNTPPFNPDYHMGGHYLAIGMRPEEDVLSVEPTARCNPD